MISTAQVGFQPPVSFLGARRATWLLHRVPETLAKPSAATRRVVTPEALGVAPSALGMPLADPWRRFAAMLVDLTAVGLLSLLSGPWLGLATGAMLLVLFGNSPEAPFVLKAVRS